MEVAPRIDPHWFERRAVRGVVLMTLADIAFKPLLLEWLSHVGRLGYRNHINGVYHDRPGMLLNAMNSK